MKNKSHLLWLLIFETGFMVVLIGLLVCVVKGKRSLRPPRASVVFGKYGRSIAGGVESPSLLPLLLLLPPPSPPPLCYCCCCCCVLLLLLLLLLLLFLLLAAAAASSCCSCCCCCCGGYRFHMMEKPSQPRRRP